VPNQRSFPLRQTPFPFPKEPFSSLPCHPVVPICLRFPWGALFCCVLPPPSLSCSFFLPHRFFPPCISESSVPLSPGSCPHPRIPVKLVHLNFFAINFFSSVYPHLYFFRSRDLLSPAPICVRPLFFFAVSQPPAPFRSQFGRSSACGPLSLPVFFSP